LENGNGSKLCAVLNGERQTPPPIWLMRQAGRFLPEYRELRAKTGSFWKMCMTPATATEITLQPIRRFGFDAAIIFSDILVIPYALGREIAFEDGVGPSLDPVRSVDELQPDENLWSEKLAPVYESIRQVRSKLDAQSALLGFAGAPWTLATYMAEGKGSSDQQAAKLWSYRDPVQFAVLLDLIGRCIAAHLIAQLEAGADAVQIFDSWASGLPERAFAEWVIAPTRNLVERVRASIPDAKIIGFPRGATMQGYERYAAETGVDAISLDTAVPMHWAAASLGGKRVLQGNLDPIVLMAGGRALNEAVDGILSATHDARFIFNLGHGVLPNTPVEHVENLLARVRGAF
jgi:uroporphyrinogen decarboxylase